MFLIIKFENSTKTDLNRTKKADLYGIEYVESDELVSFFEQRTRKILWCLKFNIV